MGIPPKNPHPVPFEQIESRIHTLRGQRVMLDSDLAPIYGVSTIRLNQQVRRNRERFADDFMFQLTKEEVVALRLQNAILKPGRGRHRKYRPYAFTEHGAVMISAILRTPIAVAASMEIVRAFNRLRHAALAYKELALALTELAQKVSGHDEQFKAVFAALGKLANPPPSPRKKIGFRP